MGSPEITNQTANTIFDLALELGITARDLDHLVTKNTTTEQANDINEGSLERQLPHLTATLGSAQLRRELRAIAHRKEKRRNQATLSVRAELDYVTKDGTRSKAHIWIDTLPTNWRQMSPRERIAWWTKLGRNQGVQIAAIIRVTIHP